MASITIDQAIKGILGLGGRVANRAVEIMKEEASVRDVPRSDGKTSAVRTGKLVKSIKYTHRVFSREYAIGPHVDYAEYFRFGRGPITKAWNMHWNDPDFGSVYTKHVDKAPPNHFIERTKERLEGEKFNIVE